LDEDLHRLVRGAGMLQGVADAPNRQELLTALTTEHFALQGARTQTVSESSGRAALYVSAVSSTLIALGFIGQISEVGDVFDVFALTALPTLYLLGLFTFVRLAQSGVEDILYGRAINRIRGYYLELAGDQRRWFTLSAHDDALGVVRNMGIKPGRLQLYFAAAMMIAVINSVVGGSAVALAVGAIADPPIGIAVAAGGAAAILSLVLMTVAFRRIAERDSVEIQPLLPSSPPEGASSD
jgi:hypothetical protein